ncbi:MAG: sugar phosphate isomerase/epimerase family protein [Candidatus Sumerlaeia bacterium]
MTESKIKLGVFSVSMPDYEPMDALEVLAELGYDGVEWRVTNDEGDRENPSFWSGNRTSMTAEEVVERADALKTKASELGLEMPSLGTYIGCEDLQVVEGHMMAAKTLGAKSLRIGPGGYDKENGHYWDDIKKAKEQYAKVADLAAEHGVRALIETHMNLLCPSVSKTMRILEGLDPKHVGIMWDPGNQVKEGLEVYSMALDMAGEYLAEVHVKNMRYEKGERERGQQQWSDHWCRIQDGIANWPAIIDELKKRGYEGWMMFEDFSTEVPLKDRLKNNVTWFRELLG